MSTIVSKEIYHSSKKLIEIIGELNNNKNYDKSQYCLFLDIDGTISEFNTEPQLAYIPNETLNIIKNLKKIGINIFFITGRSINIAQKMLQTTEFSIAGSHGLEIKIDNHRMKYNSDINLLKLKKIIEIKCLYLPELLIEYKNYSIALHYRKCPQYMPIVENIMKSIQSEYPSMKIIKGKFVHEILPNEANKGTSIEYILSKLNLSHFIPIFIGDDITDECAFKVINDMNGMSIKVGEGLTRGRFRLKDINHVSEFMNDFYYYLK